MINTLLSDRRNLIRTVAIFLILITVLTGMFAFRSNAVGAEDLDDTVYYRYTAMYRVNAGDTLYSIAEMYMDDVHYDSVSDYVSELRKVNQMYDGDTLKSGELIAVTYYSTEYK